MNFNSSSSSSITIFAIQRLEIPTGSLSLANVLFITPITQSENPTSAVADSRPFDLVSVCSPRFRFSSPIGLIGPLHCVQGVAIRCSQSLSVSAQWPGSLGGGSVDSSLFLCSLLPLLVSNPLKPCPGECWITSACGAEIRGRGQNSVVLRPSDQQPRVFGCVRVARIATLSTTLAPVADTAMGGALSSPVDDHTQREIEDLIKAILGMRR